MGWGAKIGCGEVGREIGRVQSQCLTLVAAPESRSFVCDQGVFYHFTHNLHTLLLNSRFKTIFFLKTFVVIREERSRDIVRFGVGEGRPCPNLRQWKVANSTITCEKRSVMIIKTLTLRCTD